jgi:hypothetical protein
MVKVNHGWHSHTIDEVESLASQAASPTSSTSTLHGHHGTSASPQLPLAGVRRGSYSADWSPDFQRPGLGRPHDSSSDPHARLHPPHTAVSARPSALAPPAAIQPRQQGHLNARRNSNPRYSPSYLLHSQQASPHTPVQPSPLQSTPGVRSIQTPQIDPILFSPHQDMREKEALETLMFMSSPGNSANMKHSFPSAQNGNGHGVRGSQRTALPGSRLGLGADVSSQGRKPLPGGRQQPHGSPIKRVEFEISPTGLYGMDMDDGYARHTPRRRTIGGARPSLSVPASLGVPTRPRPTLNDDDIERMLDRVSKDEDSDADGDLPLSSEEVRQRESAGVAA